LLKYILSILLLLPFCANASGWATENARISALQIEGGIVKVSFDATDSKDPDGCKNLNVVILENETTTGERQFSALLAAQMADRPVKIWVSGCVARWNQDWPKVVTIIIQ